MYVFLLSEEITQFGGNTAGNNDAPPGQILQGEITGFGVHRLCKQLHALSGFAAWVGQCTATQGIVIRCGFAREQALIQASESGS